MKANGASLEELEALYRAQFESFVRVATAICHDPEAGGDSVQSAFVAAVKNRSSFRGDGTVEAWAWQIVVNKARHAAARRETASLDEIAEPAANGDPDDDPIGVRRFVAALPPRQREVIFLRYFADLDYATIAHVLGLELGTVSATLSAAHHTLRARLEASPR